MASAVSETGFTGSQHEPSRRQLAWLRRQMQCVERLHHGACIGSDWRAHRAALAAGVPITIHPPTKTDKMMALEQHPLVTVLPPEPYLDRNKTIVRQVARLLALPDGHERVRSGTWSTVRFAVRLGVPVSICYPDGKVEHR